jgi:hypothetical protein
MIAINVSSDKCAPPHQNAAAVLQIELRRLRVKLAGRLPERSETGWLFGSLNKDFTDPSTVQTVRDRFLRI